MQSRERRVSFGNEYEEGISPKSGRKPPFFLDRSMTISSLVDYARPSSPLERKAKEAEDIGEVKHDHGVHEKHDHEEESIVLRRTISLLNAQHAHYKRENQELLETKDRDLENVKNELLNLQQLLNSERLARKKAEERVVNLEEEIVKLRRLALAYKTKIAKSKMGADSSSSSLVPSNSFSSLPPSLPPLPSSQGNEIVGTDSLNSAQSDEYLKSPRPPLSPHMNHTQIQDQTSPPHKDYNDYDTTNTNIQSSGLKPRTMSSPPPPIPPLPSQTSFTKPTLPPPKIPE